MPKEQHIDTTNLLRKAHKFARPISTITWAVFFGRASLVAADPESG
jgi:hypothetical protein